MKTRQIINVWLKSNRNQRM